MVCAVHHSKLNWNKTARHKNENSVTLCYKHVCYYYEWYTIPIPLKIQNPCRSSYIFKIWWPITYLRLYDTLFRHSYIVSIHFFKHFNKHFPFVPIIHTSSLDKGRTSVLHMGSSRWCFLNAWDCNYMQFSFQETYIQSFLNPLKHHSARTSKQWILLMDKDPIHPCFIISFLFLVSVCQFLSLLSHCNINKLF
jgi:hypothetical protein